MTEIERKFLVTNLPDLKGYKKFSYERYYLPSSEGEETRIQKKGDIYELENKLVLSNLSRKTQKQTLTKTEFENLKRRAGEGILRESYDFGSGLTVKVYKGRFEGLIRAEKEFASEEEAAAYQPESWFGKEITNTPLGKDKNLITLTEEDFKKLLVNLK